MGRILYNLDAYPNRTMKDLFEYSEKSRRENFFIHVLAFKDTKYLAVSNSFNSKTLFNIRVKVVGEGV